MPINNPEDSGHFNNEVKDSGFLTPDREVKMTTFPAFSAIG
jgi:hypothetical protein